MKKRTVALMMAFTVVAAVITGCGAGEPKEVASESTEEVVEEADSSADEEQTTQAETEESSDSNLIPITAWSGFDPQVGGVAIIAKEKGFFEEEGLDVSLNFITTGIDMVGIAADNTVQLLYTANGNDAKAKANGCATVELATNANIGGTQAVVARPGLEITSAADLEGLTIGMMSGADIYIEIQHMCDALGVDFSSLTFTNLAPSDQLAAMETGDIDLMACWEPYCSLAEQAGGTLLFNGVESFIPGAEGSVDWLNAYTTISVQQAFLDENPEACKAILRASIKAADYLSDEANIDECAEILADTLDIETETAKICIQKNIYDIMVNEASYIALCNLGDYMIEQGQLTAMPEFDTYTDYSILEEVAPEKVQWHYSE